MLQKLNHTSSTNYQLIFSKLPFENDIDTVVALQLNVFSTVLPGVSFNISEEHGQGASQKIIWDRLEYTDGSANFLVDEEGINGRKLYKWLTYINNNKDQFTRDKTLYATDATMIIKNNYGRSILKFEFKNVFPFALTAVDLSYQEGQEYLKSNVNLSYDYYDLVE